MWRVDIPALSNLAGLAWAAKPINAATPELGTSVCLLPTKHQHAVRPGLQRHIRRKNRKSLAVLNEPVVRFLCLCCEILEQVAQFYCSVSLRFCTNNWVITGVMWNPRIVCFSGIKSHIIVTNNELMIDWFKVPYGSSQVRSVAVMFADSKMISMHREIPRALQRQQMISVTFQFLSKARIYYSVRNMAPICLMCENGLQLL